MKKWLTGALGAAILWSSLAGVSSASAVRIESQVDELIGTPYRMGGTTTAGFDCSGFILYIMEKYGEDLPRTSQSQAMAGTEVDQDDLQIGDLVFFNTNGRSISHAGIYMGDNTFAHSSTSRGVIISKLSEKYYKDRYVTARRVVSERTMNKMTDEIHP
ncbi:MULTISPECIES: C40 family peptidase [Paenibacillus]|uniref:C40 family peptidase n=1 Tax=Paenibacillus TaxID=44249 RepID=UPI00036EBD91|nr:C40 family peptidase [Paenibacillus massiliensis]